MTIPKPLIETQSAACRDLSRHLTDYVENTSLILEADKKILLGFAKTMLGISEGLTKAAANNDSNKLAFLWKLGGKTAATIGIAGITVLTTKTVTTLWPDAPAPMATCVQEVTNNFEIDIENFIGQQTPDDEIDQTTGAVTEESLDELDRQQEIEDSAARLRDEWDTADDVIDLAENASSPETGEKLDQLAESERRIAELEAELAEFEAEKEQRERDEEESMHEDLYHQQQADAMRGK